MKDEALRLALEALEDVQEAYGNTSEWFKERVEAVRKALEQPEPEPVAWMWRCKPYCGWPEWSVSLNRPADSGRDGNKRTEGYEDIPLYTSPPKREPLTDEEIERIYTQETGSFIDDSPWPLIDFVRAIEAAHGIKGEA